MSGPLNDSAGCPSAIDFVLAGGMVLITRCQKPEGHAGKRHSDKRSKQWTDQDATWIVTPPRGKKGAESHVTAPLSASGAESDHGGRRDGEGLG